MIDCHVDDVSRMAWQYEKCYGDVKGLNIFVSFINLHRLHEEMCDKKSSKRFLIEKVGGFTCVTCENDRSLLMTGFNYSALINILIEINFLLFCICCFVYIKPLCVWKYVHDVLWRKYVAS